MGNPYTRSLLALLATSVAFNCYLGLSRGDSQGSTAASDRMRSVRLGREQAVPRADGAAPFEACTRELSETRLALSLTKGDLEQRIEAQSRFDGAEREAAVERRVQPAIERAIATMSGLTGNLECRGDTCQVRVSAPTREHAKQAWKVFTADPDIASFADSFTMEAGEPVVDLATGKGAFEVDFFITTKSATDLTPRLEALIAGFKDSSAMTECSAIGREPGVLEIKLALIPDEARLALSVGGSLAGTSVGRCLVERLSALVNGFSIPPGVTHGQVYASFESPPTI
ncbi:MAG: hypothetical protein H0X17_11575 [Deltaproteobacteria bacterium]|nr:hypothetical protein [Deltaproteobacteria bacterium]